MKRFSVIVLAVILCLSAVLPVMPEQPAAPLVPVVEAATYETAWWPAPAMNITQLAFESYSHGDQNALDFAPGGRVFAPFTGKVTYKNTSWGFVVLQSTNKVYYADGTLDYMTACFMHDGDISNISVGQIINQGTAFYDQGGMGNGNPNAYGYHVHMSIWQGQYNLNYVTGKGGYYAYKALAINPAKTTSIIKKGKMVSGNYMTNGAPSDYSNLWKNLSQVQSGPPTYASVSTASKDSFKVNENVTFNMNSDGESNTLWIYKPDGTSTYYQNAGTAKTLTFATAGKYQALVEAWNGKGSKQSSKITFYVGNPTSATIKTNKSSYTTAESVTFTMTSDGASNTLWIYKPDGTSTYYQNAGTSKSLTFSNPGKYEALVEAWNGVGSKCSSKISFTVTQAATPSKPTSATIKSDKSSYTVGENVNLTFSGNGDTNTLWIYYPDGTSKYYQEAGTSKTMTFTTPGKYEALVETWNGQGSFCSSKISFTVNAAVTKPTSATLKANKSTYAVNEDVILSVTANGSTNDIYMARIDGQWSDTRTNVGTSLTMNFGWAGTYEAYVITKNSAGSFTSAKIQFVIGTPTVTAPPTRATISANKTSMKVGESITFTMSSDGESNTLWLYKPDGTSEYYEKAGTSKTMTFSTPGKYEALVEAWNGAGSKTSSKISFTVTAPTSSTTKKPTTSSSTSKPTTSSSTSKPTTSSTTSKPTTSSTTSKPTTSSSTTKKPTSITSMPTTVKPSASSTTKRPTTSKKPTVTTQPTVNDPCEYGHAFINGSCVYCGEADPNYEHVHTFEEGVCTGCGEADPNYNATPDQPGDPGNNGGSTENTGNAGNTGNGGNKANKKDAADWTWLLILLIILLVGGIGVVLFLLLKKKK